MSRENGGGMGGTLYREPMEGLAFPITDIKKSEDISGNEYKVSNCALLRLK